jgi:peptidase E
MTTYILHGGFTRERNELNDSMYRRIVELIPVGGKLLFVLFAAEAERAETLFQEQIERVSEIAAPKMPEYLCASEDSFVSQVESADAILIRGGSTNRLLAKLKGYPNLAEAFMDKIVMGSSAGAYALSAFNYDKSEKGIRAGLNLVPVRTICHYGSPNEADGVGDEAIEVMNHEHIELPLVVLKDCEWKEFEI